jgi:hypothetical protein
MSGRDFHFERLIMAIYTILGTILSLGIIVYALLVAGSKGRITIIILVAATYILQKAFPGFVIGTICFVLRILIAICCYIYIKFKNA